MGVRKGEALDLVTIIVPNGFVHVFEAAGWSVVARGELETVMRR